MDALQIRIGKICGCRAFRFVRDNVALILFIGLIAIMACYVLCAVTGTIFYAMTNAFYEGDFVTVPSTEAVLPVERSDVLGKHFGNKATAELSRLEKQCMIGVESDQGYYAYGKRKIRPVRISSSFETHNRATAHLRVGGDGGKVWAKVTTKEGEELMLSGAEAICALLAVNGTSIIDS